jgi:hypothetical protein
LNSLKKYNHALNIRRTVKREKIIVVIALVSVLVLSSIAATQLLVTTTNNNAAYAAVNYDVIETEETIEFDGKGGYCGRSHGGGERESCTREFSMPLSLHI